jgi:catechol 2,3-dioxygenase-like lactoylglutathione lyase family enzyme
MPESQKPQTKILPRIDHITLNVKDFEKSKQFYKSLFVDYLGGFVHLDNQYVFGIRFENNFLFEISPENPDFAGSKFNRYQVGLHHFALELENKEAVDNIYEKLLELKTKILDKPTFYPEYEEGYYAVFCEDLNGFKVEFMCYEK